MSMFDNYTQNTSGNNMHTFLDIEELDEIIIGGTATHIFTLNFSYSGQSGCTGYEIFYKQSLTDVLYFNSAAVGQPVSIEENNGKTTITVTLAPFNTEKFVPYRDTFAQLKLHMKDGSTLFGDINGIIVKDTLEPKPTVETTYQEATIDDLVPLL